MISFRRLCQTSILSTVLIGIIGCEPPKKDPEPNSLAPEGEITLYVNKDNYLSGKAFCEKYKEETKKEFGVYIQVPKNYEDPNQGTISLYVHSYKPFDPSKKTQIHVNGGPGQNSHGASYSDLSEILDINQLYFDQRGLGCSAPDTYEQYRDINLYSTANTVRDLEEIRKHFNVKSWSVYGISYGTVPATLYGSKYPESTDSVILEGVLGSAPLKRDDSFVAEKLNLVIKDLNSAQLQKFADIWEMKESKEYQAVKTILRIAIYGDRGYRSAKFYLSSLINEDGSLNESLVDSLASQNNEKELSPQKPGAVDSLILMVIYCKDLGLSTSESNTYQFSRSTKKFVIEDDKGDDSKYFCENSLKISQDSIQPYDVTKIKVRSPIYYFQGTHDGATPFLQALDHWKHVPQGESYFALSIKAGHNPLISKFKPKEKSFTSTLEFQMFKAATFATNLKEVFNDQKSSELNTKSRVNIRTESEWKLLNRDSDLNPDVYQKYTEGIQYTVK